MDCDIGVLAGSKQSSSVGVYWHLAFDFSIVVYLGNVFNGKGPKAKLQSFESFKIRATKAKIIHLGSKG